MPRKRLYTRRTFCELVARVASLKPTPHARTLEAWIEILIAYDTGYAAFVAKEAAKEKLEEQRRLDPEAVGYIEAHLDTHLSRVMKGLASLGIERNRGWVRRVRRLVFDVRGPKVTSG